MCKYLSKRQLFGFVMSCKTQLCPNFCVVSHVYYRPLFWAIPHSLPHKSWPAAFCKTPGLWKQSQVWTMQRAMWIPIRCMGRQLQEPFNLAHIQLNPTEADLCL